jgi:exodeoxyribonuclease VII small subunit
MTPLAHGGGFGPMQHDFVAQIQVREGEAPLAAEKSNSSQHGDDPSFEQALAQLEQIVHSLEEGQTGLSDSLAQYEQGVKLLRQCHDLLAQAERKIEVLAGFDAQGNPVTEAFSDAAGNSLEEKADARSRRRSRPRKKQEDLIDGAGANDEIPF